MRSSELTLKDKTLFITGAGFDIGKALSIHCAKQGARIILMDSDIRALNVVYDAIMSENGPEPIILKLKAEDLSAETAALVRQQISEEHGKLDALIHTANAAFPLTPVHLLETEVMGKAFQVLHTLPQQITRELLPVLNLATRSTIIFTSHFSAQAQRPFWGYHSAPFAALQASVKQWAKDTEKLNISVYSIDPDEVKTAVRKKHYPAEAPSSLRLPDDSALIALYMNLLCNDGKGQNGQHFTL